jgi:hypothetical protein
LNYITKETFELQGFISFLNIIRCNKNYLILHELKKWGDRMLTGMEVQRESGQSKGENSEVVRLKKKINALIELLEKTQREKQYLNTFVDSYIQNNAPVEFRIKEVIHVLIILTKEAKWLDSAYQTSSSRNYYRIKTDDFEDILERALINIPRKKMIKVMADIGILKCDDGHYTYPATIQRKMYRVYMLKKSAVNTLIGEQEQDE